MTRLLIDGYNLLYPFSNSPSPGEGELADLLESLRRYKRLKGHAVTVVLDGYEGGMPMERKEQVKGISVVYTRIGEKADQAIERRVRQWGGSCVVVTSDRALSESVEREGAVVVEGSAFAGRLRLAESLEFEGEPVNDEARRGRVQTRKKGNPKRKSKKQRARERRLRKL